MKASKRYCLPSSPLVLRPKVSVYESAAELGFGAGSVGIYLFRIIKSALYCLCNTTHYSETPSYISRPPSPLKLLPFEDAWSIV